MSYYFVSFIKINDLEKYQKYINEVDELSSKFNGKYLALDDNPKILEGNWNYSRSVIIKFNTETEFNDWYYSEEYQRILKYRLNASKCDTILIKGKEN
jgi:uncharacterized protein (DUF1330 family)